MSGSVFYVKIPLVVITIRFFCARLFIVEKNEPTENLLDESR